MATQLCELPIASLAFDTDVQCREALRSETVGEYREAAQAGAKFPPLVVFYDGKIYWVADGFHRGQAFREAGIEKAPVDIRQGTKRDAILFAVGANASHGLRRTNADKRRAVETLLRDSEWCQWSDRELARRAGVSDRFVNSLRGEHAPTANGSQSPEPIRKCADGKTRDVSNIGKAKPDAILFAVGANASHGLRRTNADKRRAVETLLRDSEWCQWSDRELARRAGVSDQFVANLRPSLSTVDSQEQTSPRKCADGRTINTSNIGKAKPDAPKLEPRPSVEEQTEEVVEAERYEAEEDLTENREAEEAIRIAKTAVETVWNRCPAALRWRLKASIENHLADLAEGG